LSDSIAVAIVDAVVKRVTSSPGERADAIEAGLPLLMDCVAPELLTDKMMFARFKLAFIRKWQATFPDIPVPDFEGVFDYDSMVKRFVEHLLAYRERVYAKLGTSIRSAAELERALRAPLLDVLFSAVLDALKFKGKVRA